jgi:hypothetical protein
MYPCAHASGGVAGRRITQAIVATRIVNQVELSEAERRPAVQSCKGIAKG